MKYKFLLMTEMALFLMAVMSCQKTPFLMGSYSQPCLDWGSPVSVVEEYMDNFSLIDNAGSVLHYKGRKLETVISYSFSDGSLVSADVIIPAKNTSLSAMKSSLSGYLSLGEINSSHVYLNEEANTLAMIKAYQKNDQTYYSVGWTKYSLE